MNLVDCGVDKNSAYQHLLLSCVDYHHIATREEDAASVCGPNFWSKLMKLIVESTAHIFSHRE